MHIFPFTADIDLTATEVKMYMTPWMSPSLVCMVGEDTSECPEKHIIVAYEWPMAAVNYSEAISKFEKEKLHLERAVTDAVLATGAKRIEKYEEGGDPPDFIVYRDGKPCNLDLVQFTYSKRRRANAIFEKIKEEFKKCEPIRFVELSGTFVYVDFGRDGKRGSSLPFTKKESEYIDKLLIELSEFKVDGKKWETKELPEKLPELNDGESEGGAGFLVAPMSDAVPATPFFYKMGFELGLAYYTRLSTSDAWKELVDRVYSHDKESIEEILISAGAPNEAGLCFPSDEAFILLALNNPPAENPLQPKFVKSVVVHIWSTGAIWEIYPSLKVITRGIYKGLTPLNHVIQRETS